MARTRNREATLRFQGFMGGVNTASDPLKLPPHVASRARNVIYHENGIITRRGGSLLLDDFGTGVTKVLSMHEFRRAGATRQILRHTSDGVVAYSTNDGDTWTTIVSSQSTTEPFSFVTFNDMVYMSNGTNDFAQWDGATRTAFASVPKGRYLTAWKDSVWMAYDSTNYFRVRSSAAGDGTTWPATQFIDVGKGSGGGGKLSGIHATADALVVFKEDEHWAIYDPVEFTNRHVDLQKGTLSHFSIVEHEGIIYFWSRHGICIYLGDAPAQIVSDAIANIWRDNVYQSDIANTIVGYTAGHKVGWTYPAISSANYVQIEYYPRISVGEDDTHPWLYCERPANWLLSIPRTGGAGTENPYKLIGGSDGDPNILEYDLMNEVSDYRDSGVDIFDSYIISAHFDLGDARATKHLTQLFVHYRGRGMEIQIVKNGEDNAVSNTYTLASANLQNRTGKRIDTDVFFNTIAFKANGLVNYTEEGDIDTFQGSSLDNGVDTGAWSLIDFQAFVKILGNRQVL